MKRQSLTLPERKALRLTVICLALLGGAGIFLGYANPIYQLPPLALLFPACLATLGRIMPSNKGAFYAGWLCAAIGNCACLYWVTVPMHDFGMLPWPLTVPPLAALGGYLGLYGGLYSLLYRVFRERLPFAAALLLACPLWIALETAKGLLFTGFPWLSLSTAFLPWPIWVQFAAVIGANGLSGVFALSATALAEAAPVALGFSPAMTPKKRRWFCAAVALIPLAAVYAYGLSVINEPLGNGRRITVGLVQGNIDQNQKWDAAYQEGTLARYLTLSEWAVNPAMGRQEKPVDLLLWPETAMPFYLETNGILASRIASFSRRFNVPVAFGAPGKDTGGGRGYYNRLWLQTPDGKARQHYDKTHLVPFGEYVPLSLPLQFIEYFLQGLDFVPGLDARPLQAGDIALGPLICYEAIFPELARERVALGANILVNISNDAWFGRTAAPVQHLHLTAMRAIEQGRYIVRATNTGISAIITPRGRIALSGSLFRAEALAGEVRLESGLTVFHHASPFITWGCALLVLGSLGFSIVRARRYR